MRQQIERAMRIIETASAIQIPEGEAERMAAAEDAIQTAAAAICLAAASATMGADTAMAEIQATAIQTIEGRIGQRDDPDTTIEDALLAAEDDIETAQPQDGRHVHPEARGA